MRVILLPIAIAEMVLVAVGPRALVQVHLNVSSMLARTRLSCVSAERLYSMVSLEGGKVPLQGVFERELLTCQLITKGIRRA